MRLVDEEQEIVRKIVQERGRLLARLAAGQMHRVVLNARAVTGLLKHLEVIHRTLAESRCLEQLTLGLQLLETLFQLLFNITNRRAQLVLRRHEVLRRVDVDFEPLHQELPGQRIDLDDSLDFIAEELDAQRDVLVGGKDLERVAPDPKASSHERHIVTVVLNVDQMPDDLVSPRLATATQRYHCLRVFLWRPQTIDA